MKHSWQKAFRNKVLGLVSATLALGLPIVSAVASQSTTPQQDSQAPPPAATSEQKPAQQLPGQSAQDQTPPAESDIPKIRAVTNEVNVVFTVTDKHGRH